MKIYKENAGFQDKIVAISVTDLINLVSDLKKLSQSISSYCTSNDAYKSLLDNFNKGDK